MWSWTRISDIGYRISIINQWINFLQPTNQPPSPLSLISMPILFIILLFLITKKKLEVNLFYESIELHSLEKTIPYYTSDWLIDLLNKRVYTSIHLSIHHLFTSPKTIIQTKTRLPKYLTTNNDKQPKDNNNKKKERNKVTKTQEYIKLLTSQAVSTQICRSSKSRHDQEDQSKSLLTPKAKRESETIWSSNSLVFELILANQNQKTHT